MSRIVLAAIEWLVTKETPFATPPCSIINSYTVVSTLPKDTFYHQTDIRYVSELQSAGLNVNASPMEQSALTIIIGSRVKEQNYCFLNDAINGLKSTGRILFGLENDLGGKSFVKTVKKLFPDISHYSKKHSQLILLTKEQAIAVVEKQDSIEDKNIDGLYSHPGIFSWEKTDKGTALLLEVLSEKTLAGNVLDIGCGNGALGIALLEKNSAIDHLTFLDCELRGIEATRSNIYSRNLQQRSRTLWEDIFSHKPSTPYDTIVSNLPFHNQAATDRDLPKRIVKTTSHLLNGNGDAYFLWHSQPPNFSDAHWQQFSDVQCIFTQHPYWIIHAKTQSPHLLT